MAREVIHYRNMPTRLPMLSTLVLWLALDRLDAAGWIWGVVGTVMAIVWICALISLFHDTPVDIFTSGGRRV